jgi:hypothetical protein
MKILRALIVLALAGGASHALAEQIKCESQHNATQACGTVQPGSSVELVQQLSSSPCIEGSSWGTGPDRDSIWVSNGCRAVFDVQPQGGDAGYATTYDHSQDYERGYDRDYADRDDRNDGRRYASAGGLRTQAREACIDQAAANGAFERSDVDSVDERWQGHGTFAVILDTPDGRMTCTVDRDGNVQSIDER